MSDFTVRFRPSTQLGPVRFAPHVAIVERVNRPPHLFDWCAPIPGRGPASHAACRRSYRTTIHLGRGRMVETVAICECGVCNHPPRPEHTNTEEE